MCCSTPPSAKSIGKSALSTKRDLLFHSETRGLLDHGSYYAMKSMVDAHGRRILWGWVQETRIPRSIRAAAGQARWRCPACSRSAQRTNSAWRFRRSLPLCGPRRGSAEAADFRRAGRRACRHANQKPSGEIVCGFKVAGTACGLELRAGAASLFAIRYQAGRRQADDQHRRKPPCPSHPDPDGVFAGSSMDGWFGHRGLRRRQRNNDGAML